MAEVRSLLARAARLEQARAPAASPFVSIFGSVNGFTAMAQVAMDAGTLDRRDGPHIIAGVARWHRDGVWELWQ